MKSCKETALHIRLWFCGATCVPSYCPSLSRTRERQDLFRKNFEQHVEKASLDVVSRLVEKDSEPDSKTYLDTLLEVHMKYSAIIMQHLYGDVGFIGSLCNARIVFVNRNAVMGPTGSKSSEVLVKYADRLLRKDKSLEEIDVEGALDRLMVIFNYLEDKDVFLHFYATTLSKRLILLLYNDHSLLSLSELVTTTSIPKEILTQVVSVLVKVRILVIEDSEQYGLNSNFKSKKVRVNVNQPIKAEGQTEVMRAVQEDQKYVIQATIARIMKAQKSMTNEHLVQDVIEQISQRFTPQVPTRKKDYIQREEDALVYVA